VRKWPYLRNFASCISASRVQHISDLHSKFALKPHHVWKYVSQPICDRWELPRKKDTRNHRGKIECPQLRWAAIKTCTYHLNLCRCITVIMAALRSRCGHYIFALWFLLRSFFFSSPNLSCRRLDVYHTSTHGVTLVWISDAGLKRAARGWLKIQDAKSRQKIATLAPLYNFVGLYLRN